MQGSGNLQPGAGSVVKRLLCKPTTQSSNPQELRCKARCWNGHADAYLWSPHTGLCRCAHTNMHKHTYTRRETLSFWDHNCSRREWEHLHPGCIPDTLSFRLLLVVAPQRGQRCFHVTRVKIWDSRRSHKSSKLRAQYRAEARRNQVCLSPVVTLLPPE